MTIATPAGIFKSLSCFSELSPEALDWLIGYVKEISFNKGQIILLEGERCPGLFVVKSGSVKLYQSSPEGEEKIVRIVRSGGCFECVPLLDRGNNPVSSQALEASELYLLPASRFEQLFTTYPELTTSFVSILARRLRSLVNIVGDFNVRRLYPRLAALLYQLAERKGEIMVVSPSTPLGQQHLACMLGCSRQAVNSALRKLVAENIIRMDGHRIIVLDTDALGKIS